jgi:NitT/TauT family transport system substrate-binding protein
MQKPKDSSIHICLSQSCDCGMSRRDFLRLSSLTGAAALPFLRAGDAWAQKTPGADQPVRIGYLPITDATPLLVAHARKLFEEEGLVAEAPRLFRSWAQIVEAFVAGQINVIHLLSPATLWVRYGTQFPAKIVACNHMNGSGLTVAPEINSVKDLGGKTVAIPFWYSIHNILLQKLLVDNGLTPVTRTNAAKLAPNEVNLLVQPPAEMIAALANKSIAGFIVADPFNAAAETNKVGKILRFSGDVWRDHACCVTFIAERDIAQRPDWVHGVTNAIVKAQAWSLNHLDEIPAILASDGGNRYTPHTKAILQKVFSTGDYRHYEESGVVRNQGWHQRRIDFQPYPFPSYTEELVRALHSTHVEGDKSFLAKLDPAKVASDLVDDRFVRQAINLVGGPKVFNLPENLSRTETLTS